MMSKVSAFQSIPDYGFNAIALALNEYFNAFIVLICIVKPMSTLKENLAKGFDPFSSDKAAVGLPVIDVS